MWRNQKFCKIWRNSKILHVTYVKKSEIYPVFGCEIGFMVIYAIFCVICFVAICALLRGKNLAKNCIGGEKMTNMRYDLEKFQIGPDNLIFSWNNCTF